MKKDHVNKTKNAIEIMEKLNEKKANLIFSSFEILCLCYCAACSFK